MDDAKLEWMYKDSTNMVDKEEYLLGRRIDSTIETQSVSSVSDLVPGSIFSTDTNNSIDAMRKIKEDPLEAIREKEREMRKQLLKNPVLLKKMKTMLEKEKLQKKNIERQKVEKKSVAKKKKKKKDSNFDDEDELNELLAKKFAQVVDKFGLDQMMACNMLFKKKKKKKSESSEEETSSSSSSGSDTDEKHSIPGKELRGRTKEDMFKESKKSKDTLKDKTKTYRKRSSSSRDEFKERTSRDRSEERRRTNKDKSKERRTSRDRSKERRMSRDMSKERRMSRDRSKERRTSRDRSKERRTSRDRSKERRMSRDRSKERRTNRDRSKERRRTSRDRFKERRSREGRDTAGKNKTTRDKSKEDSPRRDKLDSKKDLHYGLSVPAGAVKAVKMDPKKNTEEKVAWKRPLKQKLSEKDKAKKLEEMMSNASWRSDLQASNMKRYKEAEDKEKQDEREYDEHFAKREFAKAVYHGTVEKRIKSNLHHIQRSSSDMDKNFARR